MKNISDSLSEAASSFIGAMGETKENVKLLANYIIRSIEYLIERIVEFARRTVSLLIQPKEVEEVELPEIKEREMVTEIPVPVEWPTMAERYPAGVFDAVKISLTDLVGKIEENAKSFVEYVIQLIKRLIEFFIRVTGEIKGEIKVAFIELRARASGFLSGAKERTVGLLNNIAETSARSLAMAKEYLTLFVRRLTRLIKPVEVELPREVAIEAPIPVELEPFPELEERPSIFDTVARSFTGLLYKVEENVKSFAEYITQLIRYLIGYTGRLAKRIAELSAGLTSKVRKGIAHFHSKVKDGTSILIIKVRENTPILTTKVIEFLNNATRALVGLTDKVEEYVQLLAGYLSRLITHLIKYIIRLVKKIASLLKREERVEYIKLPEVEVTEVREGVVELEIKPSEPVTIGEQVSSSVQKVVESLVRLINKGRKYAGQVLRRGRE